MNVSGPIESAIKLANDSYKAGHDEGYKLGFKEGVAAAQKIINETFSVNVPAVPEPTQNNGRES